MTKNTREILIFLGVSGIAAALTWAAYKILGDMDYAIAAVLALSLLATPAIIRHDMKQGNTK